MVGRITFRITRDGETEITVVGSPGSSCADLTRPFEDALGSVKKRIHTDEFYQESETEKAEESA